MEHDIHMNHSIQLYTESNTTTCMPTTVNCYQQHTGSLENEGHHTISCWGDTTTTDFSPVSSDQDTSQLLPAIHDRDENSCSGNNQSKKMPSVRHINYMLEIENTAQNSSEQITTPDHPTDIKD